MADGVLTPADGALVSTEEITDLNGGSVSAQHVQRVVLTDITADGQAEDIVLGGSSLRVNVQGTVALDSEDYSGTAALPVKLVNEDGDTLTLDGTTLGVDVLNNVVVDSIETALPAGDNNIGNVDVVTLPALVAGSANIGDVDVLTVPADPFGANADAAVAAGATGSIQAKLRNLTSTNDAIKTAVEIVDDWDESDRAKVNLIVGQAGVQGASGAVSATTQRVVLATDVALPAGTNNIGDVDVLTLPASTNTLEVVGDVAQDVAVAGNPVLVGMRASTAIPTAMSADGRAVYPWANRSGAQVVTTAPHIGLNSDPWNLVHETAQYTTTQTSTVLVAGGASEKLVVTKVQIQVGGTTAGTLQLYFGTGAYSRGTSRAIFDGEFAPSATLKPGVVMDGPFIAGTNGDDLMVTDSAAINPLTITVWYYVVT